MLDPRFVNGIAIPIMVIGAIFLVVAIGWAANRSVELFGRAFYILFSMPVLGAFWKKVNKMVSRLVRFVPNTFWWILVGFGLTIVYLLPCIAVYQFKSLPSAAGIFTGGLFAGLIVATIYNLDTHNINWTVRDRVLNSLVAIVVGSWVVDLVALLFVAI